MKSFKHGRKRLLLFFLCLYFFCEVTFTVTLHLRPCFVFAKISRDVIFVDVIRNHNSQFHAALQQ